VRNGERGFTLVEVTIAMTVMAVGLLVTAPMFVYAAKENAVAGDLGSVGALAVERMEELRGTHYYLLQPGGDLESNVSGYSDLSNPDYDVRWSIAEGHPTAGVRILVVRAVAKRQIIGRPKEVTLMALRGE
jgi:prepilin-type N-terminal cleavage/methylation domain-containing protein